MRGERLLKRYWFVRSVLTAIFLSSSVVLVNAQITNTNWSSRIVSKKKYPLTYFISPHVSAVNVLIVDNKRFEHVRGLEKFYLPVPQIAAIVFLTDEKDYSVTYHVFKMDRGEDVAIHGRSSVFGHTIGSPNSSDSIEKADEGSIVLCNLDQYAKSVLPALTNLHTVKSLYYLDLKKKSVAAKTLYYDKAGKLILERGDSLTSEQGGN